MSSRAQELADAARKLPSVERAAFLAQACGADQELLDQAKSLLTSATGSTDEAQWMKQTRDAGYQAKNAAQATEDDSRLGSAAAATTTSQSLERGTPLGRYVVLNQLGSGGMGVVYAAFDPEMNRKVAIKLLRADVAGKLRAEVARARLLREAQAMARLSHPNIVPVHDVGTFGSQVFIVMEYVEGQTLKRWLEVKRPSTKEIVAKFLHAGRALAAAHAVQLIHRDFKLDNVLVAADGRVLVSDLASLGEREKQRVSGLATLSEEPALTYGVRWSTTFVCHRVFPRANVTVAERALPVMCSLHVKTSHAREAAQPKFTR